MTYMPRYPWPRFVSYGFHGDFIQGLRWKLIREHFSPPPYTIPSMSSRHQITNNTFYHQNSIPHNIIPKTILCNTLKHLSTHKLHTLIYQAVYHEIRRRLLKQIELISDDFEMKNAQRSGALVTPSENWNTKKHNNDNHINLGWRDRRDAQITCDTFTQTRTRTHTGAHTGVTRSMNQSRRGGFLLWGQHFNAHSIHYYYYIIIGPGYCVCVWDGCVWWWCEMQCGRAGWLTWSLPSTSFARVSARMAFVCACVRRCVCVCVRIRHSERNTERTKPHARTHKTLVPPTHIPLMFGVAHALAFFLGFFFFFVCSRGVLGVLWWFVRFVEIHTHRLTHKSQHSPRTRGGMHFLYVLFVLVWFATLISD